jgi:hypothetical protein
VEILLVGYKSRFSVKQVRDPKLLIYRYRCGFVITQLPLQIQVTANLKLPL